MHIKMATISYLGHQRLFSQPLKHYIEITILTFSGYVNVLKIIFMLFGYNLLKLHPDDLQF